MPMPRKVRRVSIKAHFDRMDSRFDALDLRFDSMESRFGATESRQDAADTRFATIDFRIAELQKDMRAGFAAMERRFDKVMTVLDTVVGRLHDNEQSHTLFGSMLRDHRRTLESHDLRLTSLESRLPPRAP